MDQKTSAKDPFAADEPVVWRGIEGCFGEIPRAIWYRIDKGPWQVADTMDRVPPGAELHPCHLQRGPQPAPIGERNTEHNSNEK